MKIGQQDAKEFFMCLDENQQLWADVFNIFKLSVLSETELIFQDKIIAIV